MAGGGRDGRNDRFLFQALLAVIIVSCSSCCRFWSTCARVPRSGSHRTTAPSKVHRGTSSDTRAGTQEGGLRRLFKHGSIPAGAPLPSHASAQPCCSRRAGRQSEKEGSYRAAATPQPLHSRARAQTTAASGAQPRCSHSSPLYDRLRCNHGSGHGKPSWYT